MSLNGHDILERLHSFSQRSQQLRAALSADGHLQSQWSAVGFRVGQSRFLVSLDETREVFTYPDKMTQVPNAAPWVSGIANLRGELLPLLDLQYFLHNQPTRLTQASRIIMMNHADCNAGLLVDEVYGLHHFSQPPESSNTESSPYIYGNVFHQNINWHVFSFNLLAADQHFLNVAAH
jgi:twitching motility protein PilI